MACYDENKYLAKTNSLEASKYLYKKICNNENERTCTIRVVLRNLRDKAIYTI
jgi:hypothetical protein